jgi:Leucine-rich repeat (LRR) protein
MTNRIIIKVFSCLVAVWLAAAQPMSFTRAAEPEPEVALPAMTVGEALQLLEKKRAIQSGPKIFNDGDLKRVCTATATTELDLSGFYYISDEGFAEIAKLTELRKLNLYDCRRLTCKGLEVLTRLKKLESLRLARNHVQSGEIYDVLLQLTPLKRLILKECVAVMKTGQGLARLKAMKGLRHLDLSCYGGLHGPVMDDVVQLTQLTYLNLDNFKGCPVSLDVLKEMEKMTSLEFLGLAGHHYRDDVLDDLYKKLKNLKQLHVGGHHAMNSKNPALPSNLTHLVLDRSWFLEDQAIINLGKKSLKELNLERCVKITDKGLKSLQNVPTLRYLNAGSIQGITDVGANHIKDNTGLTYLGLFDNDHITNKGLSALTNMKSMRRLKLWHLPKIDGAGLVFLRGMDKLEHLDLSTSRGINDEGLEHVKSASFGTGESCLKTLYLDNLPKITDKGVSHLARHTNLEELTLIHCVSLTDDCLHYFENMKSLTYLDLSYCEGITVPAVEKLMKVLPNCDINY